MSLAWSESLRAQIERPLAQRNFWFAVVSVFFLFPLSLCWSLVADRRAKRRNKSSLYNAGNPWIVSVGNVAVGGMGKSPIVRAVARLGLSSGYDVAVLTRGVGQDSQQVVVCPLKSTHEGLSQAAWESLGDESLEHLLALRNGLPEGATLWVAQGAQRDRVLQELLAARSRALALLGTQHSRSLIVIVDDGLQQTALPVHLDVVVWDPQSVLASPRCALPFGPYRVGWPFVRPWARSLPPADVLVWSRLRSLSEKPQFDSQISQALQRLYGHESIVGHSSSEPSNAPQKQCVALERTWLAKALSHSPAQGFTLEVVPIVELPSMVNLLCGIARPERFKKSLLELLQSKASSSRIATAIQLADHGELNSAARVMLSADTPVVMTLKDVCRWWRAPEFQQLMRQQHLYVLCLEADLHPKSNAFSEIGLEPFFSPQSRKVKND